MRKDNTQNYQTPNSRIQHFSDFTDNQGSEKEELKRVDRSFTDNEDQVHNLPNLTKYKYNRVSNKMDDMSKDQVKDKIKSLEDDGVESTDHKFKIVDDEINPNHNFQNVTDVKERLKYIKSFEGYTSGFGFNNNEMTPKNDMSMEQDVTTPFSDDDNQIDDEDCENCVDYDEVEYEDNHQEKSYMFFNNLETIHKQSCEMSEMDENTINSLLNDGHNWAEDHISVAKELLTQVCNFLSNEGVSESLSVGGENEGGENYMFFANLKTICRLSEEILSMDKDVTDELLENGHDWAEDHIAAAKEDVQQVYEFIKTEI